MQQFVEMQPRRRGAVIVMVVASLILIMGLAALTIDVGYLYNLRAELQNTADAAAMAGANVMGSGAAEVRAKVRQIAEKQEGLANLDLRNEDIILGIWDASAKTFTTLSGADEENANAVRVITRMTSERGNPASLFFAGAIGVATSDVSASATASFAAPAWNVVIVQDITNSFVNEIDEARLADQDLLDCIRENTDDESQVGIVVFTGYGKVISPLKTIGTNFTQLSATIAGIKSCGQSGMPPCSGTNIGAGLDFAIPLLSGLDSEYPPAIIIVSDGEPNSSLPGYTNDDLKQWAIDSADLAAAEGISVFTLFYSGNDGSPTATAFLASLIRGKGTAHDTPDPAEMETKLKAICKEGLPVALVE